MRVRPARPSELPGVMGVLDGALLAVEAETVGKRIREGRVLVAAEGDRILGACVLDGDAIDAIAVRRKRRGQDIGTRLVESATALVEGDLRAEFDERVRPFYDSLGFAIEPTAEPGRFRGRYEPIG